MPQSTRVSTSKNIKQTRQGGIPQFMKDTSRYPRGVSVPFDLSHRPAAILHGQGSGRSEAWHSRAPGHPVLVQVLHHETLHCATHSAARAARATRGDSRGVITHFTPLRVLRLRVVTSSLPQPVQYSFRTTKHTQRHAKGTCSGPVRVYFQYCAFG